MTGFESPNYTQSPNDLFDWLPSMTEAELRVTLIMIRQTFGFHRDGFRLGVKKLATASGLSRQGALYGAQAAETRGTFKRVNKGKGEAQWELVVPLYSLEGGKAPTLYPLEATPLTGSGKLGVKERKKKINKDMTPDELKDIEARANKDVDHVLEEARAAADMEPLGRSYRHRDLFEFSADVLGLADAFVRCFGSPAKAQAHGWLIIISNLLENHVKPIDVDEAWKEIKTWDYKPSTPSETFTGKVKQYAIDRLDKKEEPEHNSPEPSPLAKTMQTFKPRRKQ